MEKKKRTKHKTVKGKKRNAETEGKGPIESINKKQTKGRDTAQCSAYEKETLSKEGRQERGCASAKREA